MSNSDDLSIPHLEYRECSVDFIEIDALLLKLKYRCTASCNQGYREMLSLSVNWSVNVFKQLFSLNLKVLLQFTLLIVG